MGIAGAESDPEQRFLLILGQKCFTPAAARTSTASTHEGTTGHSHWVLLVPQLQDRPWLPAAE